MIGHLDHLVLTTTDEVACLDFYTRVLGMTLENYQTATGLPRKALKYGQQKINLHLKGFEYEPRAHLPVPGALDRCVTASIPLQQVIEHLAREHWPIIVGPVLRTGATQQIRSVYVRDPDLNLIEIAELC